ncbi:MAG TPA: hypothetical protein VD970_18535, partial [Acetobacteraceae bacterium]|nr:hypothetical protein [Acetobacteraceae bacterium]
MLNKIAASAARAVHGRDLPHLIAYSYDFDEAIRAIRLKAHFAVLPSEDEIEEVQDAETEVLADFGPSFSTMTEIELVQDHAR